MYGGLESSEGKQADLYFTEPGAAGSINYAVIFNTRRSVSAASRCIDSDCMRTKSSLSFDEQAMNPS
jgi:hypothetical protein